MAKEVREGRHDKIRAERRGGVLRYCLVDAALVQKASQAVVNDHDRFEDVSVTLAQSTLETVDLLAETRTMTRPAAVAWLVGEGIRTGDGMEQVRKSAAEIRKIKQSLGR